MKIFSKNKSVLFNYTIIKELEAGISLKGSEVKSIKAGEVNLKGSFVKIENNEAWVHNLHIKNFKFSTYDKLDPKMPRKLLLKKKEIAKLLGSLKEKGKALLPLEIYQKARLIKLKIVLGQGKKNYDKRQALKEKENKRTIAKIKKNYR